MSYPPQGPLDPQRPQDTPRPQDGPRAFPTYGRPPEPQQPYGQPPYGAPPYGQQPPGASQYGAQSPQPGPPQYGAPPGPYPAYGYGYGYPGVAPVKTNGLATAALVCGLGGLVIGVSAPVGVGLGIAALVQIKRRHESGTAQAVAGIVVGGLVTALGVLIIAFAIILGSSEANSGEGARTSVDSLAVGECFDDGGEDKAYRRSCNESHDGEIVSNVTLPAGPYPGDSRVEDLSEAACDTEFAKYVGNTVDKSELRSDYWYPDEEYWESGDRVVVCAALAPDGEALTRTVKDSKR